MQDLRACIKVLIKRRQYKSHHPKLICKANELSVAGGATRDCYAAIVLGVGFVYVRGAVFQSNLQDKVTEKLFVSKPTENSISH